MVSSRTEAPPFAARRAAPSVARKPFAPLADECIRQTCRRTDRKRCQIVGSGGVFTPEDAYRKIKLGASLVQILTSLLYEGPGVVRRLTTGIAAFASSQWISSVSYRM
jgi:dihydroorotate dehydrogenase